MTPLDQLNYRSIEVHVYNALSLPIELYCVHTRISWQQAQPVLHDFLGIAVLSSEQCEQLLHSSARDHGCSLPPSCLQLLTLSMWSLILARSVCIYTVDILLPFVDIGSVDPPERCGARSCALRTQLLRATRGAPQGEWSVIGMSHCVQVPL